MKKNKFFKTDVYAVSHLADFRSEYRLTTDASQTYFADLSTCIRIVYRPSFLLMLSVAFCTCSLLVTEDVLPFEATGLQAFYIHHHTSVFSMK